jgi:heat shock protein HslJ
LIAAAVASLGEATAGQEAPAPSGNAPASPKDFFGTWEIGLPGYQGFSNRLVKCLRTEAGPECPRLPDSRIEFREAGPALAFDFLIGCNQFRGSLAVQGETVSFDRIAGTLRSCAKEIEEIDEEFLRRLKAARSFRLDRLPKDLAAGLGSAIRTIEIIGASGAVVVVFLRQ